MEEKIDLILKYIAAKEKCEYRNNKYTLTAGGLTSDSLLKEYEYAAYEASKERLKLVDKMLEILEK